MGCYGLDVSIKWQVLEWLHNWRLLKKAPLVSEFISSCFSAIIFVCCESLTKVDIAIRVKPRLLSYLGGLYATFTQKIVLLYYKRV
jgi:hypothetical protein